MSITPKKEFCFLDIVGGIVIILCSGFIIFYFYNLGVSSSTKFFLNQSDWECNKIERLK